MVGAWSSTRSRGGALGQRPVKVVIHIIGPEVTYAVGEVTSSIVVSVTL